MVYSTCDRCMWLCAHESGDMWNRWVRANRWLTSDSVHTRLCKVAVRLWDGGVGGRSVSGARGCQGGEVAQSGGEGEAARGHGRSCDSAMRTWGWGAAHVPGWAMLWSLLFLQCTLSSFTFSFHPHRFLTRTSISTNWFSCADYVVPLTHHFHHILSRSMMTRPFD